LSCSVGGCPVLTLFSDLSDQLRFVVYINSSVIAAIAFDILSLIKSIMDGPQEEQQGAN
jgi:hypothetical protein